MVLSRAKLLEHMAFATVGVVVSVIFTACVKAYRDVYGHPEIVANADDGGHDVIDGGGDDDMTPACRSGQPLEESCHDR